MPGLLESHLVGDDQPPQEDTEQAAVAALWARYWSTGDRAVRNELILSYENLVGVVLSRLPSTLRAHWETDDLHSFGLLGLVEAIDRFEVNSATGRFPAYAMARVRGAIFDELRRLDWLPRTVRRKVITYRSTAEELASELGRQPATSEVLTEMGVSGAEASDLLQAVQSSQLVHLQQQADSEDQKESATIVDLLSASGDESPEAQVLFSERIEEVREAIGRLPERQRSVVSLRFFGGLTQEQVGAMLGVSNSRICQIESAAIGALRRLLAEDAPQRQKHLRVS